MTCLKEPGSDNRDWGRLDSSDSILCCSVRLTTNPKRGISHYRWQPQTTRDHRSSAQRSSRQAKNDMRGKIKTSETRMSIGAQIRPPRQAGFKPNGTWFHRQDVPPIYAYIMCSYDVEGVLVYLNSVKNHVDSTQIWATLKENILLAYKIKSQKLGGQSRRARQDSSLTMGIFECHLVNFIFREGNCGNLFINTLNCRNDAKTRRRSCPCHNRSFWSIHATRIWPIQEQVAQWQHLDRTHETPQSSLEGRHTTIKPCFWKPSSLQIFVAFIWGRRQWYGCVSREKKWWSQQKEC